MIPFCGHITNLGQSKELGQYLFKFMTTKIASYEVNCKIQFTKIICAENWRIFGQKYMTHANLLYMRKLYIHIRI